MTKTKTSDYLSANAAALLTALRACHDGEDFIPSDDHVIWNDVYLDNAFARCPQITTAQRGGYLRVLRDFGVYREIDGRCWGAVRSEDLEDVS